MTKQDRRNALKGIAGTELEKLYTYILQYQADNELVPSYEQICEDFKFKALNQAMRRIHKLVDLGLIQKVPRTAHRGYKVV